MASSSGARLPASSTTKMPSVSAAPADRQTLLASISPSAQAQQLPLNGSSVSPSTAPPQLARVATSRVGVVLTAPTSTNTSTSTTTSASVKPVSTSAPAVSASRAQTNHTRPASAGRVMHSRHTTTASQPTPAPSANQHRHQSSAAHRVNNAPGRQFLTANSQRLRPASSTTTAQPAAAAAAAAAHHDVELISTQRLPGERRITRYLASDAYSYGEPNEPEPKVEVVAYCRNIQNPQVLRDAIKGFRGHQVNYFVIDSCKMPSFPNDLFVGIDVRWLEMSNSTLQFHNNFLHPRSIAA